MPQEWKVKGEPESMAPSAPHFHFIRTVLMFCFVFNLGGWGSGYYLIWKKKILPFVSLEHCSKKSLSQIQQGMPPCPHRFSRTRTGWVMSLKEIVTEREDEKCAAMSLGWNGDHAV